MNEFYAVVLFLSQCDRVCAADHNAAKKWEV